MTGPVTRRRCSPRRVTRGAHSRARVAQVRFSTTVFRAPTRFGQPGPLLPHYERPVARWVPTICRRDREWKQSDGRLYGETSAQEQEQADRRYWASAPRSARRSTRSSSPFRARSSACTRCQGGSGSRARPSTRRSAVVSGFEAKMARRLALRGSRTGGLQSSRPDSTWMHQPGRRRTHQRRSPPMEASSAPPAER